MKKTVLIGPVYPYKGGISHYTGLLYRALSGKYETVMVSYKMQYPKFLFKKEQKDYSNDRFRIEDTHYWLNTANPFTIAATAWRIRRMKPDLVILQWWHPYFAPCYFILTRLVGKSRILFVCHNVFPHERFPMDRFLTKLTLRGANRFIVHSESDAKELLSIRPHADYRVAVHPTYNAFQIAGMSREEARQRLGIGAEEKILLFFGFVRPYKGLKYLLDAMPEVCEKVENVRLLIVGEFGDDREDYMRRIEQLHLGEAVTCREGYIPDAEVEPYFAACNVVVLPYESATQSGIVQIAYGFEKPVIVTRVGGLPDVVEDGSTGYIAEAQDPASLAEKIERYFAEDREREFAEQIAAQSSRFSWDRLVTAIEELTV